MGKVHRGTFVSEKSAKVFQTPDTLVCNKAITSTSKLESVALGFLAPVSTNSNRKIPTLFTYNIDSYFSLFTMSIKDFSEIPQEEEVLLLPGVLMSVVSARYDENHILRVQLDGAFNSLTSSLQAMIPSFAEIFN